MSIATAGATRRALLRDTEHEIAAMLRAWAGPGAPAVFVAAAEDPHAHTLAAVADVRPELLQRAARGPAALVATLTMEAAALALASSHVALAGAARAHDPAAGVFVIVFAAGGAGVYAVKIAPGPAVGTA